MHKHYERTNDKDCVVFAYSTAFLKLQNITILETDICVNENGGRHYNPDLFKEDGFSKYKYVNGERVETTDEEWQTYCNALLKEL
jgi:hypothetical protein